MGEKKRDKEIDIMREGNEKGEGKKILIILTSVKKT